VEQKEFEHITQGVRSRVMSVAASFRLAEEDAEDIAQDTMLRLWTMRDELKRYRSVEALAVSVARHLCIDSLKRRRTLPLNGKIISDESHSRPDDELETADDRAWLERRLRRLPPREYQILRMRQVENKSNQDIADILGITPQSVATKLSAARHKLLEDIKRRNK